MLDILEKANQAKAAHNWSLLIQYLQQLILTPSTVFTEPEWQQIVELALTVLHQGDFQQRWEIAKVFPPLGTRVIKPLISLLEEETIDVEVNWFVARILGEFSQPEVIMALVNILQQTEDEELAAICAQSLAHIGHHAINDLNKLLENEATRLLAVRALAYMHRPETIDSLMQVIHDANPEIRTITLESLSNFSESNLIPIFLMALQDKVAKVRREAVIALGLRANQETEYDLVKHLKPLLSDPYPEVCQQAAIALGRMGTNEAAEALFHVLKSPATPPWLKLEMVRALSRIETVQALDYLQEGLRWASTEVCQEIIKVLGTRLTPSLRAKATKILIDFCHSGQSAVNLTPIKQVLATSLGELGEPEAVVTLQKLATDAEATVRLHALAALKKIPQLR